MLRTYKFYILWVTYFIGAGAGLMVIGSVAGLAKKSMGSMAFVAVAIMALGNAGGRDRCRDALRQDRPPRHPLHHAGASRRP